MITASGDLKIKIKLTLDEMYKALRSTSLIAWSSFLKERLYNIV